MSPENDIQKMILGHLSRFLVGTEEKCNDWVCYNDNTRFGTHIRPLVGKEDYYRYEFVIEKRIGYRYKYAHRDVIMIGDWGNFRHEPVVFSKKDVFVKDGYIKGFSGNVPLNVLLGIIQGWVTDTINDIDLLTIPANGWDLSPTLPPILL